ncbi:MAG: hypothetical protein WCI17_05250 [bacterium]
MNNNTMMRAAAGEIGPATYSPFWPLTLALAGLILLLSWNLHGAVRQSSNLRLLEVQLGQAAAQSAQAEQKLRAMLSDLMELATQDAVAATIIRKYQIRQNAPAMAPKAASSLSD